MLSRFGSMSKVTIPRSSVSAVFLWPLRCFRDLIYVNMFSDKVYFVDAQIYLFITTANWFHEINQFSKPCLNIAISAK